MLDPLAGPVSGDPARLQQVVWNLLSNAVKFTPKGGRVQVLLERVNSHVEITVTDTGMGIRPEFLPHVFDRFRQADASTTRRHGGLGLGPGHRQATGRAARRHGAGQEPRRGPGVDLRRDACPSPSSTEAGAGEGPAEGAEPPASSTAPTEPLAGIRVLVVDDEPDARQLVRRVLTECEAEVAVAESAAEALELVETFRPDILVSDIGMPGPGRLRPDPPGPGRVGGQGRCPPWP